MEINIQFFLYEKQIDENFKCKLFYTRVCMCTSHTDDLGNKNRTMVCEYVLI